MLLEVLILKVALSDFFSKPAQLQIWIPALIHLARRLWEVQYIAGEEEAWASPAWASAASWEEGRAGSLAASTFSQASYLRPYIPKYYFSIPWLFKLVIIWSKFVAGHRTCIGQSCCMSIISERCVWLEFYAPVLAFILFFLGFFHVKVWLVRVNFIEIKEYLMQITVMRYLDCFVRIYYQRWKCYFMMEINFKMKTEKMWIVNTLIFPPLF